MKNKHTILLLGIGLYYILYKMYSKKKEIITKTNEVIIKTNVIQPALNPDEAHNIKTDIPKQFLIDNTNVEEDTIEIPNTYQNFYVKSTTAEIDPPNTYQTYYGKSNGNSIVTVPSTYQTYYSKSNINKISPNTNTKGIRGINNKVPCTC